MRITKYLSEETSAVWLYLNVSLIPLHLCFWIMLLAHGTHAGVTVYQIFNVFPLMSQLSLWWKWVHVTRFDQWAMSSSVTSELRQIKVGVLPSSFFPMLLKPKRQQGESAALWDWESCDLASPDRESLCQPISVYAQIKNKSVLAEIWGFISVNG